MLHDSFMDKDWAETANQSFLYYLLPHTNSSSWQMSDITEQILVSGTGHTKLTWLNSFQPCQLSGWCVQPPKNIRLTMFACLAN